MRSRTARFRFYNIKRREGGIKGVSRLAGCLDFSRILSQRCLASVLLFVVVVAVAHAIAAAVATAGAVTSAVAVAVTVAVADTVAVAVEVAVAVA
eukprot:12111975-Karenia_brevis.AAC.1